MATFEELLQMTVKSVLGMTNAGQRRIRLLESQRGVEAGEDLGSVQLHPHREGSVGHPKAGSSPAQVAPLAGSLAANQNQTGAGISVRMLT